MEPVEGKEGSSHFRHALFVSHKREREGGGAGEEVRREPTKMRETKLERTRSSAFRSMREMGCVGGYSEFSGLVAI